MAALFGVVMRCVDALNETLETLGRFVYTYPVPLKFKPQLSERLGTIKKPEILDAPTGTVAVHKLLTF